MAGVGLNAGTVVATMLLQTNPFRASLKSAMTDLKTFADGSNNTSTRIGALGTAANTVGSSMTRNLTLPILGIGAAATKLGSEFEAQMSRVQSTAGASGSEMQKLNKQALDLGASTAFSASQVAEGMENLASAGFSTNEIMSAMPGMLDLAASSGEDLATSSDIAASTLRGFGLAASDAGHVADVLAKNAATTNAAVGDTGEAMKYVAPVAHTMGQSLEMVTAAIGEMANQGIKGGQAGTTLRQAMVSLASPTKQASKLMESIGFNAFDANGKMLPLNEVIGRLQKSTSSMTQQQKANTLSTIFGTEALSGMMVLVDQGPDKLQALTKGLQDSKGAASEMAKTNQDNVKGSIDAMMGSVETAAILIAKTLAPSIRSLADHISNFLQWFNQMPQASQQMVITAAGIVAAIGPILLIFAKLIGAVMKIKEAFLVLKGIKLGSMLGGLGSAFSFLIGPIGLVLLAIAAFAAIAFVVYKNWSWIGPMLSSLWASIVSGVKSLGEGIVNIFNGIINWFKNLGTNIMAIWNGIINWFGNGISSIGVGIQAGFSAVVTFFQTLGSNIIAIWNGIVTGIINLFVNIGTGIQTAFSTVVNFFMMIGTTIVTTFTNIVTNFLALFSGVGPALQTIFGGFISIITGIFEIIKNVVLGAVMSIFYLIYGVITGNFQPLMDGLNLIWTNIVNAAVAIWNGFVAILQGIIQLFVSIAMGIWTVFTTDLQMLWQVISSAASAVWNGIKAAVTAIITGLVNTALMLWNGFWLGLSNLWNTIQSVASALWNGLKSLITSLIQGTVSTAIAIWNGFINFFRSLPSTLMSLASSAFNAVRSIITSVSSSAVSLVINIFHGIVNFFRNLPGTLASLGSSAFGALRNAISSAVSGIGSIVSNGVQGALSFLASLPSRTFQWGKDMIGNFINGIKNMIGGVADAAKAIGDKIAGFLHHTVPEEGPLSHDDEWGGDFVDNLASGITDNSDLITNAVKGLATDMNMGVHASLDTNFSNATSNNSAMLDTLNSLIDAIKNNETKLIVNDREIAYATAGAMNEALGEINNR